MVAINSFDMGVNSMEEDLYIRTINEFRIDFENNVLFFLNTLRIIKDKKINSEYLEYIIPYFDKLCLRYHVDKVRLKVNYEKPNKELDNILMIIKRAKKAIDYSYLDVSDFYYKNYDYFLGLKMNKSFAIILKDILKEYHHRIPGKIIKAPREKIIKGDNFMFSESIIDSDFFNGLKKAADKMILKVYDYLIETNLKEINSRKMYLLKNDFLEIGKKYHKLKFNVKINNKSCKKIEDCFLDEVGANIFRVKEIFMK